MFISTKFAPFIFVSRTINLPWLSLLNFIASMSYFVFGKIMTPLLCFVP